MIVEVNLLLLERLLNLLFLNTALKFIVELHSQVSVVLEDRIP